MARKKNPFQNIVEINKRNLAALEYLLAKASEEDVIEGLRDIRRQLGDEEKPAAKLPRSIEKIEKLLLEYPEFQRETLSKLQARIKAVKEMGDLYKFKPSKKTEAVSVPQVTEPVAGTSVEELPQVTEPSVQTPREPEPAPAPAISKEVEVEPSMQATRELDIETLKPKPSAVAEVQKEETRQQPVTTPAQDIKPAAAVQNNVVQQSTDVEPASYVKKGADVDAMERILKGANVKTKDEFLIKTVKMDMAELKALINKDKSTEKKE